MSLRLTGFLPTAVSEPNPLHRVSQGWVAHDGASVSHRFARRLSGSQRPASLLVHRVPAPPGRCQQTLGAAAAAFVPTSEVARRQVGEAAIVEFDHVRAGAATIRRSAAIERAGLCVGLSFGCPVEVQGTCVTEAERLLGTIAPSEPPTAGRRLVTEADTLPQAARRDP